MHTRPMPALPLRTCHITTAPPPHRPLHARPLQAMPVPFPPRCCILSLRPSHPASTLLLQPPPVRTTCTPLHPASSECGAGHAVLSRIHLCRPRAPFLATQSHSVPTAQPYPLPPAESLPHPFHVLPPPAHALLSSPSPHIRPNPCPHLHLSPVYSLPSALINTVDLPRPPRGHSAHCAPQLALKTHGQRQIAQIDTCPLRSRLHDFTHAQRSVLHTHAPS
ncbi:hypothetical protein B0H14DRAFT_3462099 [Mycena olivaceomarginata]|nr:hypothetical protein B0H14DRAFT_3462099 [Mycena olivaceomarginata]